MSFFVEAGGLRSAGAKALSPNIWAYEKEVRLLVDLEQAREAGVKDRNGWPVKVIQPPREAIREVYGSTNTREEDLERAVQVARGECKHGLFVGNVSGHAFRMQKAGGIRY